MERLTKRLDDGQAVMRCEDCKASWMRKHGKPMEECTAMYCRNMCKDRLAAYEDTGLTPEEVERSKLEIEAGCVKAIAYEAYYTSASQDLEKGDGGVNYWGEIEVNFVPMDAQLRP